MLYFSDFELGLPELSGVHFRARREKKTELVQGGEPSIQNDAAMDTVLTKRDRIFPQQQQQQYSTRHYFVDSIRMQYATAACRTTERSTHDTGIEQQQTGQNT